MSPDKIEDNGNIKEIENMDEDLVELCKKHEVIIQSGDLLYEPLRIRNSELDHGLRGPYKISSKGIMYSFLDREYTKI